MKKRILAGLYCLLLVFRLSAPPARAAEYVCFMAAGDIILPLSDRTMPVWHNGYLYVDSTIFTGVGRTVLKVARTFNNNDTQLVLYGGGQSLWYERDADHGYDLNGGTYYPGCLVRNGEVYVPAASVAQFFGLVYSVTDVTVQVDSKKVNGNLLWLRRPGFVMTDEEFFAAATIPLADRYQEYLREKEAQTAVPPEVPAGTEIEGRSVFLCLKAGENTPDLLDALDRAGAQASFFCTPDFLHNQGDLLRRMAATGQAIGILADGSDPDWTVEEQLEAGNRALEQATCGRTRLALVQNGSAANLQAARDAGFRCLEADLDRSGSDLHTAANASYLLQRVSARRGNVTVWLADRASGAGLRAFLSAAEDADGRCLAWTETA